MLNGFCFNLLIHRCSSHSWWWWWWWWWWGGGGGGGGGVLLITDLKSLKKITLDSQISHMKVAMKWNIFLFLCALHVFRSDVTCYKEGSVCRRIMFLEVAGEFCWYRIQVTIQFSIVIGQFLWNSFILSSRVNVGASDEIQIGWVHGANF